MEYSVLVYDPGDSYMGPEEYSYSPLPRSTLGMGTLYSPMPWGHGAYHHVCTEYTWYAYAEYCVPTSGMSCNTCGV